LETEPWHPDKAEKVAKMARGMGQTIGYSMKYEQLCELFSEQIIKNKNGDEIDIGKECVKWLYRIATNFHPETKEDEKVIKNLIDSLKDDYDDGINPDEDEDFREDMIDATPLFTKKLIFV
ncbi:unnamed protein product, partial [marine sediment metagenome]